jgi:glycosyltransferase involved in cell wall biosynthesis
MPRILHLSPHYYPSKGGLERFCEDIAVRTARLNNEVHIITQTTEGREDYEEINGVKIHRIKPLFRYSKACVCPNIKQKIREIDPDVVHVQGPAPGMVDFITKNKGKKIIMTWHNDLTLSNKIMYKILAFIYLQFMFPKVISRLDKIILPSESFRYHSKFITKVPTEKISVIPNAVDLEKFSPGIGNKEKYKKELDVKSRFLIIFVASMDRHHAYKGVEYLLSAIKQIKDLDVLFVLVGDGILRQKYMEIANSVGISTKIRFTGRIDDDLLIKYYRAADIFVLPSVSTENMPIVMIEAMACGTPIITTCLHGPMEMIQEGVNGHLVKPKDSAGLARAVEMILSDESKLREMQKNARQAAIEKYSWDDVLKKYFNEYKI